MTRISPISGQLITNIVGTGKERQSFKFIIKYDKLELSPVLGDLLIIENNDKKWVARVDTQRQVSFGDKELQVQEQIIDQNITEDEQHLYFGEEFTATIVGILTDKNVSPVVRIYPNRATIVRFPKKDELQIITSLDKGDKSIAYLGDYSIGEEVVKDIQVKLSVNRFLKRRTAILGQAGFGKSNLIKSVMSEIAYHSDDTAIIIFDIDGEYSFRTEQSIGLADIKNIRDRLVVFTLTERNEDEYKDIIAGQATLNLKDLSPQEVVNSLFPLTKRSTNYAGWLLSIKHSDLEEKWYKLIDEIHNNGLDTDLEKIEQILGLNNSSGRGNTNDSSLFGLKTTLNRIIFSQHDQNSTLLRDIDDAVNQKRVVIVDLSRMPLDTANGLIETILNRLFRKNEEKFVSGQETIPILIMVEEAQNFLSKEALKGESNIVVRIAKEGRKYGFGVIYITQQPSAIDESILSQTNNFFILHLLTQGDIRSLTSNNPLYEPIAYYIQNEPLRGYSYFYSNVYSEDGKILPTTVIFSSKIRKFEDVAKELDEYEPKDKWESFLRDKRKNEERFMEIVIDTIDNFYRQSNLELGWTNFWSKVNDNLLDTNYKSKYTNRKKETKDYPHKDIIQYAEKELSTDKYPYRLDKQKEGYKISKVESK